MGERKGTNHYYPPDFDPKKHKSLNGYHGTHALRERAKKIKEGVLIIRFEMPYNIWCGGCENHIGMGVRYNAEKTKVGMYYTTPIFKFRMKCHLCDNYIEIQTDPQNFTYVIVSGARRKEERWNAGDNEQIVTEERDTVKRLVNDPMFKLDHDHGDKQNVTKAKPSLGSIRDLQVGKRDDYLLNRLARDQFRNAKNQSKTAANIDKALLEKSSLDIELVKEHEDDIRLSGLMKYKNVQSPEERQRCKREEIMNRPIFASKNTPRTPVAVMIAPLSKSMVRRKSENNESTKSDPISEDIEFPLGTCDEGCKPESERTETEVLKGVDENKSTSVESGLPIRAGIVAGLDALGCYSSSDSDNS